MADAKRPPCQAAQGTAAVSREDVAGTHNAKQLSTLWNGPASK